MDEKSFVVIESPKKKSKKGIIAAVIVMLFALFVLLLITQFRIHKIVVTGNEHYTDKETIQVIKKKGYINNSIIYVLKSQFSPPQDIPFVESLDIAYKNRNTIEITIYEKTMAGCIENMGEYMYFDKDGIVLESSLKHFDDVPLVKGLAFDSVVLNEKLPFKDKKTVEQILNITQLIRKYEMAISTIRFEGDEVFLEYKDITIALGDPADVDEKMAELPNMLKEADDLKGTLHMEKFTLSSGIATFRPK